MPIINAQILAGRSDVLKAALMQKLAQAAIDTLDVPEASVRVILTEVPPQHWGVGLTNKATSPS